MSKLLFPFCFQESQKVKIDSKIIKIIEFVNQEKQRRDIKGCVVHKWRHDLREVKYFVMTFLKRYAKPRGCQKMRFKKSTFRIYLYSKYEDIFLFWWISGEHLQIKDLSKNSKPFWRWISKSELTSLRQFSATRIPGKNKCKFDIMLSVDMSWVRILSLNRNTRGPYNSNLAIDLSLLNGTIWERGAFWCC